MDTRHIAVVVQGLFEKSDSIGYDAVFEYELLSKIFGKSRVNLFAERFDSKRYPGIDIKSISDFWKYLGENPSATVIYHYCDGWPQLDEYILTSDRQFIVRWHNNTPPWFYGASHRRSVERTIGGFRTIVNFVRSGNVRFWVNSNFTLNQLCALGGSPEYGAVVFPGSGFLKLDKHGAQAPSHAASDLQVAVSERPLRLLFVSRVVAHKGHRHVIALASYLQKVLGRDVSVTFLGRDDPSSGLKAELERQAALADVEVLLKGEVSHAELSEAYLSADLFVCFSEHEGFGMPIFEAMRMGVPVICWGRTALRELMRQHPFSFDELDFARAAAAIQLLDDKDVFNNVMKIQGEILKHYTSQIVVDQLMAALAEEYGTWHWREGFHGDLSSAIKHSLDQAVEGQAFPPSLTFDNPRDVGDNYVTLYDIESYEALLSDDRDLHRLPALPPSSDSVMFSYREFVSPTGRRLENGISFSGLVNSSKRHIIYGPYARFVRGYFAADFQIEAETKGDRDVELELDVSLEGAVALVARKITVTDVLENDSFRLLFPVSVEGAIIEFRIRVVTPGNCNFIFKGVTIRNMRQSLANLPEAPLGKHRTLPWLQRRIRSRREAERISAAAQALFRRADDLRDRAWWNDAASAYNKGLLIEPRAFAYLVQLGNCLKEAERYEESEAAYQRALSLRPDDRDLNLQLGRLYRQWGNAEAAYHHLLRAARLDVSAARAMHELAGTGFDISSLPDLFA